MADILIVGVGSSAGGLDAMQKLFKAMAPDSGLAFVMVAHLDPTHESHLTELLRSYTEMTVTQVERDTAVEANCVYVIAPDQSLTMRNGVLRPHKPVEKRGARRPVDGFFRSLAEDQGDRAIGIVLSGTGTNGSLGLRFIKAEGGIVIAQDPETAAFDGMPRSAIATGLVDLVLSPENMPEALLKLSRRPTLPRAADAETSGESADLDALLTLLRTRTRKDFRLYKKRTLLRRIHRRMALLQIDGMKKYNERVHRDEDELAALDRDLTINVSGFFRDPEAWTVLEEQVIAPLAAARPNEATIRVWVPGCATGEEAYSIAMLLAEHADAAGKVFNSRIFATDISDSVLPAARSGLYPASIAQDITPERLHRFFDREDDSYRIKKGLREMITVAPQNLLQDPPFSQIDLVSCRNLLIYLEPEVQKKLVALFHFALREDGHLFLGSAESVADQEELYRPVSKKWRIYQRTGRRRHDIVDFPLIRDTDVPSSSRPAAAAAAPFDPHGRSIELFHRALLDKHAPASVLIDRRSVVRSFHGPTGDFLQQPGGEPTSNLLSLAREGLQASIRSAMQRAIETNREVKTAGSVKRGGALHPVQLTVTPLRPSRGSESMLVVTMIDREKSEESEPGGEAVPEPGEGDLEAELVATREDLRLTIEQMETSNEELKASYEEIRSINEELQASNEELETSKEELQSLNEELKTVNNQLQAKVQELETRTNDLNNLLNSTDVATLFLDQHLRIRWFTPAMKTLLELLPGDIGRPIYHFAMQSTGEDVVDEAKGVLQSLVSRRSEVQAADDRWFIRHILPYRTEDNRIDGVVVTFTDITDRKKREEELLHARELTATVVDTVAQPLLVLTPELRVVSANASFYRTFAAGPDSTVGRLLYELGERQWDIPEIRGLADEVLPATSALDDFEVERDFETVDRRVMLLNARRMDGMQLILLAMEDITERRHAEEQRERLVREMQHRVKNLLAVVQALASQTDAANRSAGEYRDAFLGRLQALTQVHTLIEADHDGADLREIVATTIGAYRMDHADPIEAEGEPVVLSARQAIALGMVLHELCTNAAKHGALSERTGRVRIAWNTVSHDHGLRLHLKWIEKDGPPPDPGPETQRKEGFGTQFIRGTCEHNLSGAVSFDYGSQGLRCEIEIPLA